MWKWQKTGILSFGQQGAPKMVAKRLKITDCQYTKDTKFTPLPAGSLMSILVEFQLKMAMKS